MRTDNLYKLPESLPIPVDDGACNHLHQAALPSIELPATSGQLLNLSTGGQPWVVVYCYPRTGQPNQEPPGSAAAWNAILGARGCTTQSCAYRDHFAELATLGATVYGLSTQDTAYQSEAVARLHLPYSILSDVRLEFVQALRLQTFTTVGLTLVKRLTLIARADKIEKVFYPVFPSDADGSHVVEWLTTHSSGRSPAARAAEFGR